MSILCQVVGMDSFQMLVRTVSPNVTVCVRGRHAVGKSEGIYQAASQIFSDFYRDEMNCSKVVSALGGAIRHASGWKTEWKHEYGVPVVERRLSQMTEGDIIGLPELHNVTDGQGNDWRSTAYRPCDWIIQACQFPTLLFLDERNRALPGVKQAIFQLADSKVFYGHKLHPETRVCVAENIGESYQVEQSDPAEVSRWITIELDPDETEWINWAEDHCHLATIEFIRSNPKALEHRGTFEADKKYPDRRSWAKLDAELSRLGLFESENPNAGNLLYIMAGAFVGPEWGGKFNKFVQEREREVKAEDILSNWDKAKKRLGGTKGISNEQYVEATSKLGDWLKAEKNVISDAQARQYAKFMFDCPPEPRMAAWAHLQKNTNNLFTVHPHITQLMVATASGADTSKLARPDDAPGEEEVTPTETVKTGRGRK